MINRQPIKPGRPPADKLVTVVIEDTCYRIQHGDEELAVTLRRDATPITRFYFTGKGVKSG